MTYRPGCMGKVAWESFEEADLAARRLRRNHDTPFRAYRCDVCRKYHLSTNVNMKLTRGGHKRRYNRRRGY